jgi:hypothetical protein
MMNLHDLSTVAGSLYEETNITESFDDHEQFIGSHSALTTKSSNIKPALPLSINGRLNDTAGWRTFSSSLLYLRVSLVAMGR